MWIQTTHTVSLALSPEKCWQILQDIKKWNRFFPEIDRAVLLRNGQAKLAVRLGKRRRSWRAQVRQNENLRSLELTSASKEINFRLSAQVEAAAQGSQIYIEYQFSPPKRWIAFHRAVIMWNQKRLIRLLASFLLFALSALGIHLLPGLSLPSVLKAVAYAFLGMTFLVAVALLSGRHRERLLPVGKAALGKTRGFS